MHKFFLVVFSVLCLSIAFADDAEAQARFGISVDCNWCDGFVRIGRASGVVEAINNVELADGSDGLMSCSTPRISRKNARRAKKGKATIFPLVDVGGSCMVAFYATSRYSNQAVMSVDIYSQDGVFQGVATKSFYINGDRREDFVWIVAASDIEQPERLGRLRKR